MARNKIIVKDVAFRDCIKAFENGLPLPFVYYPGFYGAYFAFSIADNSTKYFCSCAKRSIDNYIKFRLKFHETNNVNPQRNFILSCSHFPQEIVEKIMSKKLSNPSQIIDNLNFKDGICHECNRQTPYFSYCHSMYGSTFVQNYGWYINKQSFEYGIEPVSFKILEDLCPDEVFSLVEFGKVEFLETYNQLEMIDLIMYKSQNSTYQKHTRRIRKIIENEVRVKFGFKKVGEAWANETLLYQLVCELFPLNKIVRHYRPEILEYLELDVFIPHLNIGIEYQGIQHFDPIDHWGGKKALKKVKERDLKKQELCSLNNIKLIYFYYYEELNKEIVSSKIMNLNYEPEPWT